jgi:hypothetical protein
MSSADSRHFMKAEADGLEAVKVVSCRSLTVTVLFVCLRSRFVCRSLTVTVLFVCVLPLPHGHGSVCLRFAAP